MPFHALLSLVKGDTESAHYQVRLAMPKGIPMLRHILLVLLIANSSSAMAEWAPFGSSGDDNTTIYVDSSTIRRAGYMVKMWVMYDQMRLNTHFAKPFMSMKMQSEYDCEGERLRTLYQSQLSGNMGDGRVVYMNSKPSEWRPFSPGSIDEGLWKYACGRK
jgi:hypothetical protein